ncbi:MAG: 2-oxoacid:acceptor oxidoreductase family protein [Peptoniphilaceae bacterium]|nr:2-oxoacid:acceptor oxidoreductase family protein [Peptoniphilaceae bacterium]MCI6659913.1 2-oxoacid:acceptor oxidoreductase family protein [Peptoniphilaceae bacterium]MDD7433752.1 2-oxoacid:acceptor oxidoreductase family protein [Peptoniphilaceae bacterium]MDY3075587.1 2-oxoacid:acceptor oxidoreductase family protein [Peptoniphilaceae bacterium]MDY3986961.1 2-oxoacid:acceptor oxidoreductase family protein [Peptoniphilaceae bacterium]
MKTVILVAGQGGQGVLSIGETITQYMSETGKYATFAPIYGPQQRGGPAKCTVVVSDTPIPSPLERMSDILICMNQNAVKTYEKDLKTGGICIYNSNRIKTPPKREDIEVLGVPADDIALEAGTVKAANTVILGTLMHYVPQVDAEELLKGYLAQFERKGKKVMDLNRRAFEAGLDVGKEVKKN